MSSHSYSQECPECQHLSLCVTENNRPYASVCGECFECGFTYWTERGQMELWEVNELREFNDLEPLTELPNIKKVG